MLKKVFRYLLAIVLTILLIEMVSFLVYKYLLNERYQNGKVIVERYESDSLKNIYSIVPHPYMLYYNEPGFTADGFRQYNQWGYRGPDIDKVKPDGVYRILCIGASTTNSYPYVKNPARAWPQQLDSLLELKYPENDFEVINAGLPFATSAEFLSGYMFRHRYFDPDLVVVEAGGNDIVTGFFEDYDPEYTHLRAHGNGYYPRPGEKALLHSWFFKTIYSIWLNRQATVFQGVPYSFDKIDRSKVLQRVQQCDYSGFERNLKLLCTTIQEDGHELYLLPYVEVGKEMLSKKQPILQGLEEAQFLGYTKVLSIMRSLDTAVHFIPATYQDFREEDFVDNCHLDEEGETTKAAVVLNGMLKNGWTPK